MIEVRWVRDFGLEMCIFESVHRVINGLRG